MYGHPGTRSSAAIWGGGDGRPAADGALLQVTRTTGAVAQAPQPLGTDGGPAACGLWRFATSAAYGGRAVALSPRWGDGGTLEDNALAVDTWGC